MTMDILATSVRVEDRRTVAGQGENTHDLPASVTKMHCPECNEDYLVITITSFTQDYTPTCLKCREKSTSGQSYTKMQEDLIETYKRHAQDMAKEKEEYRNKYLRLRRVVSHLIEATQDLEHPDRWDGTEHIPETKRVLEAHAKKMREEVDAVCQRLEGIVPMMQPEGCPQCSGRLRFTMLDGVGSLSCECGFAVDFPPNGMAVAKTSTEPKS